jgi:ABC-type transporter MlaC component
MPASLYRLPQNDAGSGAERMTVHTGLEQRGDAPVPISCAVYLSGGGWKVYAVAIRDVGQVTGYRSGFGNIVRMQGLHSPIGQPGIRNAGVQHG